MKALYEIIKGKTIGTKTLCTAFSVKGFQGQEVTFYWQLLFELSVAINFRA